MGVIAIGEQGEGCIRGFGTITVGLGGNVAHPTETAGGVVLEIST